MLAVKADACQAKLVTGVRITLFQTNYYSPKFAGKNCARHQNKLNSTTENASFTLPRPYLRWNALELNFQILHPSERWGLK